MSSEQTIASTAADHDQGSQQEGQFVNQGLQFWEKSRASWRSAQRNQTSEATTDSTARTPIKVDQIIEVVFAKPGQQSAANSNNESSSPLRAIPLPQMVEVLVDLWEAEVD